MARYYTSSKNGQDVIDITQVRFSSIVPDAPNSRASSYYDDSETNVAPCSFQSVWARLNTENISSEKVQAVEIIERAETAARSQSSNKLYYCFCCWRNPIAPIRSNVLVDERIFIVALSKVPFSDSNPLHWELLCSFYKHIMDTGRKPVARYGSHWENVGFQGEDPASDLRGVGMLGLCQLLFLSSNALSPQLALQLYELSIDKVHHFPLAVVGLNFTQFILEHVKEGRLNRLAIKENSYVSVINGIYRGCFITFYKLWKTRNCTILDFSKIANEIKAQIKQRPKFLLNMAVLRQ
uniref:ELMO domain-containing protein n=1 Tax=Panagrolaimus sp. PS1159 TaxID=55785 RepID=A0AC35GF33_9BILA